MAFGNVHSFFEMVLRMAKCELGTSHVNWDAFNAMIGGSWNNERDYHATDIQIGIASFGLKVNIAFGCAFLF